MRNKTIFRITSALLVLLIFVCGFSLNAYASDGGECPEPVLGEITSETPTITVPEQTTNDEPISEKQPNAFTPDGNMTLVDNIEGENDGQKQFIIVKSKNGHYFYIIIDHAADGENTVHFLNQVDEADLLALIKDEDTDTEPAACTCTEKCSVGAINTACPVCLVKISECAGAEKQPDETTAPDKADDAENPDNEKKSSALIPVLVLILAVGGGAAIYFFVVKPKRGKSKRIPSKIDDFDLEDEEYLNEDEPNDTDETEDGE